MKAKELKLGDCVSYKGKVAKIHSIDSPCIYVDVDDEIWGTLEDDDELSPIPLTEEILEKNGWREGVLKTGEQCYIDGWFYLSQTDERYWQFGHGDHYLTTIEYIHELQHILWALGMDDDLKI